MWATAFYAGLRRGELQARRVCDVDFGANLVSVERGWDQVEGAIEPKSRAGRRTVPLLAVLRSYLWDFLPRTGRSGEDLLFGRTEDDAFFASTVDGRAKRAWKARNKRECELAETEGRERVLLRPITAPKIQTTFDVYGHLLPGSHDEVRKRMDAYLATDNNV